MAIIQPKLHGEMKKTQQTKNQPQSIVHGQWGEKKALGIGSST